MRVDGGDDLVDFCLRAGAGAKEKDKDGNLPLLLACALKAPVEVVDALLAAHPDGEAA